MARKPKSIVAKEDFNAQLQELNERRDALLYKAQKILIDQAEKAAGLVTKNLSASPKDEFELAVLKFRADNAKYILRCNGLEEKAAPQVTQFNQQNNYNLDRDFTLEQRKQMLRDAGVDL